MQLLWLPDDVLYLLVCYCPRLTSACRRLHAIPQEYTNVYDTWVTGKCSQTNKPCVAKPNLGALACWYTACERDSEHMTRMFPVIERIVLSREPLAWNNIPLFFYCIPSTDLQQALYSAYADSVCVLTITCIERSVTRRAYCDFVRYQVRENLSPICKSSFISICNSTCMFDMCCDLTTCLSSCCDWHVLEYMLQQCNSDLLANHICRAKWLSNPAMVYALRNLSCIEFILYKMPGHICLTNTNPDEYNNERDADVAEHLRRLRVCGVDNAFVFLMLAVSPHMQKNVLLSWVFRSSAHDKLGLCLFRRILAEDIVHAVYSDVAHDAVTAERFAHYVDFTQERWLSSFFRRTAALVVTRVLRSGLYTNVLRRQSSRILALLIPSRVSWRVVVALVCCRITTKEAVRSRIYETILSKVDNNDDDDNGDDDDDNGVRRWPAWSLVHRFCSPTDPEFPKAVVCSSALRRLLRTQKK